MAVRTCLGVLGDVDTEVHAVVTLGGGRRSRQARGAMVAGRTRADRAAY